MTTLSTHVLDSTLGVPATGVSVVLISQTGEELETGVTDVDGRYVFDTTLDEAGYGLYFDTGAWFAGSDRATFYPGVSIGFYVDLEQAHHHVPLLLSPYSYTTYKGS